jgi:riboflavin kinase/FMN adenylyltransferase
LGASKERFRLKVYTKIEEFKQVKNLVATVGTFDGVHIGHQEIIGKLKEVAKQTDGETLLLTFFPHPRMVLFPDDDSLKLITTLKEKTELLASFGLDHLLILPFSLEFSRITPTEYIRDLLIRDIGVKTLVIGYNHQFGRNRKGNFELLEELAPVYGFDVVEITAQEINEIKVSSTKIRRAIESGNVSTANDYLKYKFSLSGIVIEGEQIGRQMGFPTANIKVLEKHKLLPGNGVYAVNVMVQNKQYKGMLNIGSRPTINNDADRLSIEVHLFDMHEAFYNETILVEFSAKLRDEKKFINLDELKTQLHKDKECALLVLQ